jgi:hypothetical protein
MENNDLPVEFGLALLHQQRASLRLMLAWIALVPEDHRDHVRHGAVQALGAIEDVLGVPRTFAPRDERRRERLTAHVQ